MRTETIKLGLIDRLMRVHEVSTLQRMEKLMTQAEMESRAEKSLEAIENLEVAYMMDKSSTKYWFSQQYH